GRAPDQNAFLAGQPPSHLHRVPVGHLAEFVDHIPPDRGGHLIASDALDLIRMAFTKGAGPMVSGVKRSDRVTGDYADRGILLFEILAGSANRATGSSAGNEVGDFPASLLPDLGTGRGVVRFGVHRIVELVGEDSPRRV